MSLTLILSGLGFAALALLLWVLRRETLSRGKAEKSAEGYEHVLDNIKEANAAHDRLKYDPAYADRVRKRFSRD